MDVKGVIRDYNTSPDVRAGNLLDYYYSEIKPLKEAEYEITKAIIEAFIYISCDLRRKNSGEVYLKSIYKYIDENHPEIEDKYYKNNGGGLHGYIRYIIQKHTKGSPVFLRVKNEERTHIFTTFGSGKGKYILKDLLDETASEDEIAIEKKSDITIEELELKVNKYLNEFKEFRDFEVIFQNANDDVIVPSKLVDGGRIIIYMNKNFESKFRKISNKIKEVTDEFVMFLSSEIAIQICCNITKGSLLGYNTEHFTRELMENFDNLRIILYPLTDYRII